MDNIADLLAARLATPARVLYRQFVENGLLTPTLKIRREQVLKRFAGEIEKVYGADAPAD
jgi:long-subunit acyl-CoA synthetase (AMP-forming)